MRKFAALIAVVVVLSVAQPALAADGTVAGRPDLDLSVRDNHFTASQTATLDVFVSNNGDLDRGGPSQYEERVMTARDVQLHLDQQAVSRTFDGDVAVQSGDVAAGTVPKGSAGPFSFKLEIGKNVEPGTYRIPVEVTYDYTNWIEYSNTDAPRYHDNTVTKTKYVTVVIEDRPRFEVVSESSSGIRAGDTGTYKFTLKNAGTETAYDASVSLTSKNPGVFFGGLERRQEATNVYFDRLAPGETRTFSVSAGASDDTTNGSYPVNLVVNYKNDNEIDEQSDTLQTGIAVGHEQTFAIRNTASTLRVGDDGDVTGTLVNTGQTTVTNAVLVYQSGNKNLHPRETEYALGTLEPGESADFSFRLDASSEADPGPRVLSYQLQYRNLDDEVRKSDTMDVQVDVGPETDEFNLRPLNAEVVAGSGSTVTIEVTNTANQTLTDIEAKLFTDDPLSSDDDEAFIERLEPGESAEIKFSVGAAGTALAKTYPASIDFSYEDERGDTELSDTYRVPVRVTEAESSGPPFTLIGIGGMAVFGVLVWWKRDAVTGRLR